MQNTQLGHFVYEVRSKYMMIKVGFMKAFIPNLIALI